MQCFTLSKKKCNKMRNKIYHWAKNSPNITTRNGLFGPRVLQQMTMPPEVTADKNIEKSKMQLLDLQFNFFLLHYL